MLINRVIDKADDKLNLFLDYLNKNTILDQIGFIEKSETDFIFCDYLIEEEKLCKILKINGQTIKNWKKTKNSNLQWCTARDIFRENNRLNRKIVNIKDPFGPRADKRYYSVRHVLSFLQGQNFKKSKE